MSQRCGAPSRASCELGPDIAFQQPHHQLVAVGPPQSGELRPGVVERAAPDQDAGAVQARGHRLGAQPLGAHLLRQQGCMADQRRRLPLQADVRRDDHGVRPGAPGVVAQASEPGARRGGHPARRRRISHHQTAGEGQLRLGLALPQAPGAVVAGRSAEQLGTLVVEPHGQQHLGPVLSADRAEHRAHRRQHRVRRAHRVERADQVSPQHQRVAEVVLGLGLLHVEPGGGEGLRCRAEVVDGRGQSALVEVHVAAVAERAGPVGREVAEQRDPLGEGRQRVGHLPRAHVEHGQLGQRDPTVRRPQPLPCQRLAAEPGGRLEVAELHGDVRAADPEPGEEVGVGGALSRPLEEPPRQAYPAVVDRFYGSTVELLGGEHELIMAGSRCEPARSPMPGRSLWPGRHRHRDRPAAVGPGGQP